MAQLHYECLPSYKGDSFHPRGNRKIHSLKTNLGLNEVLQLETCIIHLILGHSSQVHGGQTIAGVSGRNCIFKPISMWIHAYDLFVIKSSPQTCPSQASISKVQTPRRPIRQNKIVKGIDLTRILVNQSMLDSSH